MSKSPVKGSFLGVECGATRSVALLSRSGAAANERAAFGPANVRLCSDADLVSLFSEIKAFHTKWAPVLAGIAIGMAGARTEADRRRIRSAAAKVWPNTSCYATNDLETALLAADPVSGVAKLNRVLILSGTGSCCFGRTADGATLRYGGWGHILGDRGSGYDIGMRALRAVVQASDRDGKWPALGREILQTLQLNEPDELIDWARTAGKTEVAALAVPVFNAAAGGDETAGTVLTAAAEALASDGAQCARLLVGPKKAVNFVFAGSVLLQQPAFAKQVKHMLGKLRASATVSELREESVTGALALAQIHFGGGQAASPRAVNQIGETAAIELPASSKLSPTEQRNPRSLKLDRLNLIDAVRLMISEEARAGARLLEHSSEIAKVVNLVVTAFKRGGRLFYVGAGTSGRLGVLDAVECPPTFRVPPERVQGILAGGAPAMWNAVEGAEDSATGGAAAIDYRGVSERDVVIGIAASGRTPFVWGALKQARRKGAKTVLVCFNPYLVVPTASKPDVMISVDAGPEVLTGSTRLKAGTGTKVILNTITTLAMVRMGKVLSNLMVDLNASNVKLRERAVRIVQAVTGANSSAALAALEKSNWIVKQACQRLRSGGAQPSRPGL